MAPPCPKRKHPALGLLLLSALWAIASLRADLFPQFRSHDLPPAQSQAALYAAFAILAASIAALRRIEFPRGRHACANAGIGIGLFVVPAALAALAQNWVSRLDQVTVFSLTPVFAVVLEPHLQTVAPRQGKAALAAALTAVAGILALFPLDIPGTPRATAALCALLLAAFIVAGANCFAVALARNIASQSTLPMAAQASAITAICFAVAAIFAPQSAGPWSAQLPQLAVQLLIDLPALFLLFWLMRHLAASRMTVRFLLAPLLTILASILFEPASPPPRAWLGMALLAAASLWLLFSPEEDSA